MDVNGTRFHMIMGRKDWLQCREEGSLQSDFQCIEIGSQNECLTLKPLLTLFFRPNNEQKLLLSARRGAAVDRFGNFYWIANDRQQIFWQPSGTKTVHVYWTQQQASCTKPSAGDFQPISPIEEVSELAGLAITEHHYLVVGSIAKNGLWIFDLHAGDEPLLIRFPENVSFKPFDLAAAPGGGVWVLDSENRRYWGLDRSFNFLTESGQSLTSEIEPGYTLPDFHPLGEAATIQFERCEPIGFPILANNPISIEALPDGTVLILDSPVMVSSNQSSSLYHYRKEQLLELPISLQGEIETGATCAKEMSAKTESLSIIAHDIAYDGHTRTLYAAENTGKQVIQFTLSPDFELTVMTNYLPMHSYGGRALVLGGENFEHKVFYDLFANDNSRDSNVRWTSLQSIDEPHYARSAEVLTPVFDGKLRNCIWDGLFIDACIPPEVMIKVSTRADNDPELVTITPFQEEPPLYLRSGGAEIAYYQPYVDLAKPSVNTGTWELLFQQAKGRYLQIRLELIGNSKTTPEIRAVRAYYPRFSYVQHYLPKVYQEDLDSASFLERLLANPKGFYSDIEAKIDNISVQFDPRSATPEAIDWLAGWLGLTLDPLWEGIHKQQVAANTNRHRSVIDRRRLFIRYAPRLYELRGTPNGIRLSLQMLLDPCLEEVMERFTSAIRIPDSALRIELSNLNLPYPSPEMTREALEELMFTYLLVSHRASKVRIVERFLAREGRALAAGDPTEGDANLINDALTASAHRFSVLIAEGLPPEQVAMVNRIVELEKPAHTAFEVKRFWDYFRVGEARLAVDTVLGEESRFVPIVLGRNTLAEGYLESAPPMDTPERRILDRDRLGDTVPL
ncbi:MAG: hypothetical protein IPN42_02510 [Methylococcaceae bacterium]|nr:hypothetical protein [Methylococcaceae bacterium]